MSEMSAQLFIHENHRGFVFTEKPGHHSHAHRELSVSRPGRTGRFALLPGEGRTVLIWRSTRFGT